jgi:hypothetical protein
MAGQRLSLDGDLVVQGLASFAAVAMPADSIGNNEIGTDDPVEAEKMRHRHNPAWRRPFSETAATYREVVHVAYGDGVLKSFQIGAGVVAAGDSTATVNLFKNGVTVLSGVPLITSTEVVRELVVGTINPSLAAYVAEDVFEVSMTVSAGTGTLPKGMFALMVFDEEVSP